MAARARRAAWPPAQAAERDITPLRASVEERLRKKRCDDAAALLQRAAQELGGQAVAELALDAGDRCRTLGKRNAALNCYLAASRADPVYEAPLARLADICIDDQDIDLAVSYLERIARLTRLRGDQRGAMRVYRRIASIAPYRDDVLEMLMRAQTGGHIDG
jgi:tetratricopeptide (TPR) repeat protein